MEEWVGQVWDRLVTRAARRDHPEAAVYLEEVRTPAALMFRALGGDAGLRIEAATETTHGARRRWLSRLAGSDRHIELAWRDCETLRLPARIAWFESRVLNRRLYLWLAALAASSDHECEGDWLQRNAAASASVLQRYPGLRSGYRELVDAHLRQRPGVDVLKGDEAMQEKAIRDSLLVPAASVSMSWLARRPPQPVPLWLHPSPPQFEADHHAWQDENNQPGEGEKIEADKRRRGERVDMHDGDGGLIAFRLESLFTRAEFVNVDRTTEEDEDTDARSAIEDLDVLSMARQSESLASRLRFDLDLPPRSGDDVYLGEGVVLPEWDYRCGTLLQDHVRLQPMLARDLQATEVPDHLRRQARRTRRLFELMRPRRIWKNAQFDGTEPDLNALIEHRTARMRGQMCDAATLYRGMHTAERDLSCLLLADLSLSTDAYVNDRQRVIDVIRETLFLFGEALAGSGDHFAMYGFSSRNRDHVRFHTLKQFDEGWSSRVRGRVQAMRPGYYTRMGAAIRYASQLLVEQDCTHRLLLILTDGKPNDLDMYEGRYGVEDTRMAVREADRLGLRPFCVTIDEKARDYLPYIFGSCGYLLVRNASQLPARLSMLYARLTTAA